MKRASIFAASLGMAALVIPGCGGTATTTPGGVSAKAPAYSSAQALALMPVNWNAANADVGKIVAVTELEDEVVLFSDKGVTVLAGGAVIATDPSVTAWQAAATIPAADKSGAWAVGVDGKGHVYRLRARMSLEEITDRYGLLDAPVSGATAVGATEVAFAIPSGLAIADGTTVTRYDEGALSGVAGALGRVAGIAADGSVHLLEAATGKTTIFPLGDAVAVVFGADGKLVVAGKHALYQEEANAAAPMLDVLYKDDAATFHGLALSSTWVWAAADGDLLAIHDGAVFRTSGLGAPATGSLVGSTSGDAWALSGGALKRYTAPVSGDEATWRNDVLPVYARVCSACHAPGGTSGIPLATYPQWNTLRASIYQRVVVKGDMPQGRTISAGDKSAIASWSKPH